MYVSERDKNPLEGIILELDDAKRFIKNEWYVWAGDSIKIALDYRNQLEAQGTRNVDAKVPQLKAVPMIMKEIYIKGVPAMVNKATEDVSSAAYGCAYHTLLELNKLKDIAKRANIELELAEAIAVEEKLHEVPELRKTICLYGWQKEMGDAEEALGLKLPLIARGSLINVAEFMNCALTYPESTVTYKDKEKFVNLLKRLEMVENEKGTETMWLDPKGVTYLTPEPSVFEWEELGPTKNFIEWLIRFYEVLFFDLKKEQLYFTPEGPVIIQKPKEYAS